jgi:hypothetical protein
MHINALRTGYIVRLGSSVVVGSADGFYSTNQTVNVTDASAVRRADIILSPVLTPRQLRFVVAWKSPDLDLEVLLLTPDGCVVSKSNQTCRHLAQEADKQDAEAILELEGCGAAPRVVCRLLRRQGDGVCAWVERSGGGGG